MQADEVETWHLGDDATFMPGAPFLVEDRQIDPGEAPAEPRTPDHVRHLERATVVEQRSPVADADRPGGAGDAGRRQLLRLLADQRDARRVALADFEGSCARVLALLEPALTQKASVVLLTDQPPSGLPAALEILPLEQSGGVISTDSYMDDLNLEDGFAFSGELTDELSALTGADRPSRPTVNVHKIPAEGEAVLRRDARVDRDTLLKIIHGIENL